MNQQDAIRLFNMISSPAGEQTCLETPLSAVMVSHGLAPRLSELPFSGDELEWIAERNAVADFFEEFAKALKGVNDGQ